MPLLIHTSSYQGREALVLACDDDILQWLETQFGSLAQKVSQDHTGFIVGNGPQHIVSVDGMKIQFKPVETPSMSHIVSDGAHFTWLISGDIARKFQELVRGLRVSSIPAHQYLEGDDPFLPVLVLSKGEYEESTLMSMGRS
jgi:hypothetical protein